MSDPGFRMYAGDEPPQALADEMHGLWMNFIVNGVPSGDWRPYRSEDDLRVFGPPASRNLAALRAWTY